MNHKKVLAAASAALTIVIAILMLAPAAGAASKYNTLYKFKGGTDGGSPQAGLVVDDAGNLYGTTMYGGDKTNCEDTGCGTVFKLTPNSDGTWTETVIHTFDAKDGAYPWAELIFDKVGNLYGTTYRTGSWGDGGTVFQLTPNGDNTWAKKVLYSFSGHDGLNPRSGLIFDAAGNLYGTTQFGGEYNVNACSDGCGTVFKLAPNADGTWTENVLHAFSYWQPFDLDGAFPRAGLTFDQDGNLYGTTFTGGDLYDGTVFQLTPNEDGSWTEHVLLSLFSIYGTNPSAGLILDSYGTLYGTTTDSAGGWDGGAIFQLTHTQEGKWRPSTIYSFNNDDRKYGRYPFAPVVSDSMGNLYGTTLNGGTGNLGIVFKLRPTLKGDWKETILHQFRGHPGELPSAGLIFDKYGNLFGTTAGDGEKNWGSVFKITP